MYTIIGFAHTVHLSLSLQLSFSPGDVVVDYYLYVLGRWNGSTSGVVTRTTSLHVHECVCVCECVCM